MFGFFKKKKAQSGFQLRDPRAKEVVARAAAILEMNLMLCRATEEFESKLRADFTRGYFVGFFDGAAQAAGIEFSGDQEFFVYLGIGHTVLLQNDVPDPTTFTLDSLSLQGTRQFEEGQRTGGTEYFAWMNDGEQRPHGLLRIFHDE